MIEQQLRDGMQAAVTKEPPLGFDPDQVVDSVKRTTHRRRTAFAAAAAVVAVAAGSVTAVGLLSGGGRPAPVAPAVPACAGQYEAASQRLADSMTEVLPEVIPGARDFDTRVDSEEHGRVAGLVFFSVDGEPHPRLAHALARVDLRRTPRAARSGDLRQAAGPHTRAAARTEVENISRNLF